MDMSVPPPSYDESEAMQRAAEHSSFPTLRSLLQYCLENAEKFLTLVPDDYEKTDACRQLIGELRSAMVAHDSGIGAYQRLMWPAILLYAWLSDTNVFIQDTGWEELSEGAKSGLHNGCVAFCTISCSIKRSVK